AGATGSIIWNLGALPVPSNPDDVLASLSFILRATTDCALLVNASCGSNISLGGSISGTGGTSGVPFTLQLIQGYETEGNCIGEPIGTPNILPIDSEQYVEDNCGSYSATRNFYFCNITAPIQRSQVSASFPSGSRYYTEYPLTDTSVALNEFPASIGTRTYYAIPPGSTTCVFQFTIEVSNINSVPTTQDVTYCLNEPASPLTATPSDAPTAPSVYTLYYYVDNNPSTSAQTSIVPSTANAGAVTYYVAEGYSNSCISPVRVPINVTIYGEDPEITAPSSIEIDGCDVNSITASNARYPFSATPSADIKDTYITPSYTATNDETVVSIIYIDVISPSVSCPLEVLRTFTITNSCGNTETAVQNITITQSDFALPTNGASTVACLADAKVEPSAPIVNDACGNAMTPDLKTTPADVACEGAMVWVYTYTDCMGNSHDWSYTYTIDISTAPIVPENAGSTVECLTDVVQPTAPVVTDACGNNLVPVITESANPIGEGTKT